MPKEILPLKEWPKQGCVIEFYDKSNRIVKRVFRFTSKGYMEAHMYAIHHRPEGYPYAPFKLWECSPQGPELKSYYGDC